MNLSSTLSTSGSLSTSTKRGHISTGYFIWSYALLMAIVFAIITVLNLNVIIKVVLVLLATTLLYRLIFFNSRVRNYLIGLVRKIEDFEEKRQL